ncbi:MAG: diguanylate cyclase [Planctomycetia bacterium]|nr:diguanylate cyclase [Planctomycetia bacterium]
MISFAAAFAGAALEALVCLVVGRKSTVWVPPKQLDPPPPSPESERVRELSSELADGVQAHTQEIGRLQGRLRGARNGSTSYFEVDATIEQMMEANRKLQEKLSEVEGELQKQSKQSDRLAAEARTDALTKVFNRRAFDEHLAECSTSAVGGSKLGTLILLDVDRFKQLNDKYGHPAGDFILSRLAGMIRDAVGSEGFTARYGGEEFGVILSGASLDRTRIVAERIRKSCDAVHDYIGTSIKTTISLGLANCSCLSETTLANADRALYAAKQAGRNRTYLWDGSQVVPVESGALTNSGGAAQPVAVVETRTAEEPKPESPKKEAWFDRRAGNRKGFETLQWIAPYVPNQILRRESFVQVRCRDISPGGFSFVLRERPEFDEVVVGLGIYPNMTYVRAKLVHVAPGTPTPSTFLIGCRFAERLPSGTGLVAAT